MAKDRARWRETEREIKYFFSCIKRNISILDSVLASVKANSLAVKIRQRGKSGRMVKRENKNITAERAVMA